jgi:hypothetical protein
MSKTAGVANDGGTNSHSKTKTLKDKRIADLKPACPKCTNQLHLSQAKEYKSIMMTKI